MLQADAEATKWSDGCTVEMNEIEEDGHCFLLKGNSLYTYTVKDRELFALCFLHPTIRSTAGLCWYCLSGVHGVSFVIVCSIRSWPPSIAFCLVPSRSSDARVGVDKNEGELLLGYHYIGRKCWA